MTGASYAGVRYDPRARGGHVESYFLKANDPDGARALWLKATIFASRRDPGGAVAEAWAIAFDRDRGHTAVKTVVPLGAASFAKGRFDATIDGSRFTVDRWRGAAATADRSIAWDLGVRASGGPLVHFPLRWMYEAPVPSSKIVSLVPDGRADGEAVVCGQTWKIRGWPMTIGHNWGARHAPRYAWAHCNQWEGGEDLVFEGLAAKIALGPVLSPASTLLFVRPGGGRWTSRFGIFGAGGVTQETSFRRWRFRTTRGKTTIEGELWGETDDFVGLYYANPDGELTYCLNTKLARAELTVKRAGERAKVYRSSSAALEIGTTDPRHSVKMYV